MRIWILTSELPDETVGGIARYVVNFAPRLANASHEVTIISRSEQPRDETLAPGVRVLGVVPSYDRLREANPTSRPDTHPGYPYNVLGFEAALSYEFAEFVLRKMDEMPPPDIIESQEYTALPYFLLQRKLTERSPLEKIPILVHLHSPTVDVARHNLESLYTLPKYWTCRMERFCLKAADAILSPSRYLAESVGARVGRLADVVTIPYPLPEIEDAAPEAPTPGEIVYVGRLELRKGVLPLVETCEKMWRRGSDHRLTMIGNDTRYAPMGKTVGEHLREKYATWVEAGRLCFTGPLAHGEVTRRVSSAWAVAIPSIWDNFPNTCIEAMSLGQLVVASRSGGQAEMVAVDGENGFIFDHEKPGDLEATLHRALDLSPEQRREMGRRARDRIREMCSPERIIPARVDHYSRTVEAHRPRKLFPTVHDVPRQITGAPDTRGRPGLLTALVPYYNLGDYLDTCLESVFASTYRPREVLLVNDGSNDLKSLEVLERARERYGDELHVLTTENLGIAAARNTGVEACNGEFVAFVDADDRVEAAFFERAVDVMQRFENVDLVYSWMRYFGDSEDIWPTWNTELPFLLCHNMPVALSMVRRSSFLEAARNKTDLTFILEDWEAWLSLTEKGGVAVSLPAVLTEYRVRPDSKLHGARRDTFLEAMDRISQYHPELYRQYGREVFSLLNANGPSWRWPHPGAPPKQSHSAGLTLMEQDQLTSELRSKNREIEEQQRQALRDRDKWYQEALRMGNRLERVVSQPLFRLARKAGLLKDE